jgi:hypothetical protein
MSTPDASQVGSVGACLSSLVSDSGIVLGFSNGIFLIAVGDLPGCPVFRSVWPGKGPSNCLDYWFGRPAGKALRLVN